MAIFTVISDLDPSDTRLANAIKRSPPEVLQWFELPRGEFLVSYKGTSVELSNYLGISEGQNGSGFVIAVASYWGRASTDTWEWIKTHWEGQ